MVRTTFIALSCVAMLLGCSQKDKASPPKHDSQEAPAPQPAASASPAKPTIASPLDLALDGIWDLVELRRNGANQKMDDQRRPYAILARSSQGLRVELHESSSGPVSEVFDFNVFANTMTLDGAGFGGNVFLRTRLQRASSTEPGRWGVEVSAKGSEPIKGSARISDDWRQWEGELNMDGGKTTLAATMNIAADGKTWSASSWDGRNEYSITFRKR